LRCDTGVYCRNKEFFEIVKENEKWFLTIIIF
jgi:hypothetical protein